MKRCSLLAAAIALSGCVSVNSLSNHGLLILKPQISDGGYGTLTQIAPYAQSSIHHLILKLYTFDSSEHDQNIQKTLFNADLNKSVTFTSLKPNMTYRVKAYAYASTDDSVLISTSDANSYTDIVMDTDDRPTIGSLKVKLIDRAFNGQSTSSGIVVTSGSYQLAGPEQAKFLCRGVVSTLAGLKGTPGSVDGVGTTARFNSPYGVAIDKSGNLYVSDRCNQAIRKITSLGEVTTFAGTLLATGSVDGTGDQARFYEPLGIGINGAGTLYVAESKNNTVRKITSAGVVTTLAGSPGLSGSMDGTGSAARFNYPHGLAVDGNGNIYVAEYNNYTVRKITSAGVVTTLAGLAGNAGNADGTGNDARFYQPQGLETDEDGNVYVADGGNHAIRKITPDGVVTTLAGTKGVSGSTDGTGTAAKFNTPTGVALDGMGNLYVAERDNSTVRKITSDGVVTTVAGLAGNPGSTDGTGVAARFNYIHGIRFDGAGNLYVVEYTNNAIRVIR